MLKNFFLLFLLCISSLAIAGEEITGFWMTLNDKTKKPSSVIAVFPYEGKYYGRIIGTFNSEGVLDDTIYYPKDKAPGVKDHPFYSGLDILFDVSPASHSKYKGHIMNPTNGKVYRADLWRKGEDLVLRGKLFIFGRNVVWPPFPETAFNIQFPKPDIQTFIPKVPESA